MTNNFDLIKNYMINEGIPMKEKDMGDLFFCVMLIRRGKDHPGLPAANYTFKTYYIDSIDKFDYFMPEIIKCCDIFKLRAYVSVNVKSKEKYSKMSAFVFNQNILNNEYKKPWRVRDHVFGKITAKNADTWIIDVDDIDLTKEEDNELVRNLKCLINQCQSKYDPVIIGEVPTRSGLHILTRPFNMNEYKKYWEQLNTDREFSDIKKNHITLLYENILS